MKNELSEQKGYYTEKYVFIYTSHLVMLGDDGDRHVSPTEETTNA
jgi:hypothetical protein